MVGISPDRLRDYPHQLSGGMRQRVMIAMALALDPQVLIMDEPTTALDVVMQRQIVEQIAELRERLGFSVIFITHDVSLLIEIADRIAIMYARRDRRGRRRRRTSTAARGTRTPDALLHSFPPLRGPRRELTGIPGHPPDVSSLPRRLPVPRPLRLRVGRPAPRSLRSSSRRWSRATTRAAPSRACGTTPTAVTAAGFEPRRCRVELRSADPRPAPGSLSTGLRDARVELGGLARTQHQVVLCQHQTRGAGRSHS